MVGQEKLLKQINSYTLDTFPHTSLIVGEKGSGKHLILEQIKSVLNIEVEDVLNGRTSSEVRDRIPEIISETLKIRLYIFDFTINNNNRADIWQSAFLRLAEEPLKNTYIIVIADDKQFILNTIINRCVVFELEPYTKEQLKQFTTNEDVLSVLRTPGQILATNPEAIKKCSEVTDTIANKIRTVNLPNLLKVVDMINYKDDFDKIDFDLFFDVLINKLFTMYRDNDDKKLLEYYLFVVNERKKLRTNQQILVVDRERFIEHFLVSFWRVAHGC